MRRWRGEIDVPLTAKGIESAKVLGQQLREAGGLSVAIHDWLSRSRDTAKIICPETIESRGPRPWKMGSAFEGHPITRLSINFAQFLVRRPELRPMGGGEPFGDWYRDWMDWLSRISEGATDSKVGVVTHNRNIQSVYATTHGRLDPVLYDCDGPDFCTAHFYKDGKLTPWNEGELVSGVYLIRHGETSFGT